MSVEDMLRAHTEQDKENFERISGELKELRTDVRATTLELRTEVRAITLALSKQRGFVAGFSSAFTLLMATIIALVVYVWNTLRP